MKAIEFTAIIKDGKIQIPDRYKQLANRLARVIVLTEEVGHKQGASREGLKEILARIQERSLFSEIQDPVRWQKEMRDEWD